MQLDITSNIADFQKLLQQRANDAPKVVRKALIDATTIVYLASRGKLVEQVYNQPIPTVTRKRGKNKGQSAKAWKRTSTLLRGERFYFQGSGLNLVGIIDNKTPYAFNRHELDRPSRIDGVTRVARWREDALRESTPRVLEAVRTAIRAGLNG